MSSAHGGSRAPLLLAIILTVALGINLLTIPWQEIRHTVVGADQANGSVALEREGAIGQSFISGGEPLATVSVLATGQIPRRETQSLLLRVIGRDNMVLATARSARRHRSTTEDEFVFRFTPAIPATPGERFLLALERIAPTSRSGPIAERVPLELRTAPGGAYENGDLRRSGVPDPDADLVWAFTSPSPLDPSIGIGASVGAFALLGWGAIEALRVGARVRTRLAALLISAAVPLAFMGIFREPDAWGISDWDNHFITHESYRQTILTFRQFPLWNPVACGGTAALADPEFPVLGPGFWVELLAGVPLGLRLSALLHLGIGTLGAFALARLLGLSARGAALSALGLFASSSIPLHFVEGHVPWFAVAWLPWVLVAWRTAATRGGSAALVALPLTLMVFEGGTYVLWYVGFALLFLPLIVRERGRAFRVTCSAGLWALGFSAIRLIPTLLWVTQYPDTVYATSANTLRALPAILLGRYQHGAEVFVGQGGGWHEYGSYVGPMIVLLAIWGTLSARTSRRARILVVVALSAILLSAAGPVLKPIFDVVPIIPRSNISRLVLFAAAALSFLAGHGLDQLATRLRPVTASLFSTAIIGLAAVDLLSLVFPISTAAFRVPAHTVQPALRASSPFLVVDEVFPVRVGGHDEHRAYAATRAGYWTRSACTPVGPNPDSIPTVPLGTKKPLLSSEPPAAVSINRWSPNHFAIRVSALTETLVRLPQNAAPGWEFEDRSAPADRGLLAARVPAGEGTYTFTYRPPGGRAGLAITLGTLGLCAGRWFRRRRQRAIAEERSSDRI